MSSSSTRHPPNAQLSPSIIRDQEAVAPRPHPPTGPRPQQPHLRDHQRQRVGLVRRDRPIGREQRDPAIVLFFLVATPTVYFLMMGLTRSDTGDATPTRPT